MSHIYSEVFRLSGKEMRMREKEIKKGLERKEKRDEDRKNKTEMTIILYTKSKYKKSIQPPTENENDTI